MSVLATSAGVVRTLASTGISVWCNPIAEERGELGTTRPGTTRARTSEILEAIEVDWAYRRPPRGAHAGGEAGQDAERAGDLEPGSGRGARRLRVSALDGDMVFKRASFLADALGTVIAATS